MEFETFQEYHGTHHEQLIQIRKDIQNAIFKAQEKDLKHANKFSSKQDFQKGDCVLYKDHRAEK